MGVLSWLRKIEDWFEGIEEKFEKLPRALRIFLFILSIFVVFLVIPVFSQYFILFLVIVIISSYSRQKKKRKEKHKKPLSFSTVAFSEIISLVIIVGVIIIITLIVSSFTQPSCSAPNAFIGIRCCVPAESGTICQDEENLLEQKMQEAIDKDNIVKENTKLTNSQFSFNPPIGYLMIENLTIGGYAVPYYFITSSGEGDFIEITVFSENITQSKNKAENDFVEGYSKELSKISAKPSEPVHFTNNKGVDGLSIEATFNQENSSLYNKKALFIKDDEHIVSFTFVATTSLESYVAEDFDNVVGDFSFTK